VDDQEEGGTEWRDWRGQDTKIGDYQWKSWEEWEAAGSPIDPSTGQPADSRTVG
jgi:hypothetical protein